MSPSRIPLFGTGEADARRSGTPADVVIAALAPAVKAIPDSVSTITPAAFLTVNVVDALDWLAPAPAVLS